MNALFMQLRVMLHLFCLFDVRTLETQRCEPIVNQFLPQTTQTSHQLFCFRVGQYEDLRLFHPQMQTFFLLTLFQVKIK